MEEISFEELTLKEIISLNNENLINIYYKELKKLTTNRISSNIVNSYKGSSLLNIYEKIQEEEEKLRSYTLFPNDLIIFHNGIKESRAKSYITCDFSGAIIYPGNYYLRYRPLIENISTKNTYVLKRTIKVESGYESCLPKDIEHFEKLLMNINLESDLADGIEYSHLNRQVGGDLILTPLTKNKIKKRRYKK